MGLRSRRKSGIALVSSFDFINISYLLYFSESALLSVVFHLLKSEVPLEHGSFPLA